MDTNEKERQEALRQLSDTDKEALKVGREFLLTGTSGIPIEKFSLKKIKGIKYQRLFLLIFILLLFFIILYIFI